MLSKLLSEAIGDDVPWDLHEAFGVSPYMGRRGGNEPKYTGLLGAKHDAAMGKGFVDLGLVDPARAKELGPSKMADIIARHVATILMKRADGTAFIRDPEGIMESNGIDPKKVVQPAVSEMAGEFSEEASYAFEREDRKHGEALMRAAQEVHTANIQVSPVKGKTGDGYRFVMKPTFQAIMDRADASRSRK